MAQEVSKSFANNAASVEWRVTETPHFKIVYPARFQRIPAKAAALSEQIYKEYATKLGVKPPHTITLYINDEDELISARRTDQADLPGGVWKQNSYLQNISSGRTSLEFSLRYEIASVFQDFIHSSDLGYLKYLFTGPSASPWMDGLQAYLTVPTTTPYDRQWIRNYWYTQLKNDEKIYWTKQFTDIMLGRSQIMSFNKRFGLPRFQTLYNHRQALWDRFDYFDFQEAFVHTIGLPYPMFQYYWKSNELMNYQREKEGSAHLSKGHAYAPLVGEKKVREYLGINVDDSGQYIAAITLPASGRLLQQLTVLTKDGKKITTVDKGYFHPVVAWHPAKQQLVYSKRIYGKYGNYHYELFLGSLKETSVQQLTADKHAILPAFSPDGNQLAFVSKHEGLSTIWLMDMRARTKEQTYAFKPGQSVEYISWHPSKAQLLISYRQGEHFKVGILHLKKPRFVKLNLQTKVLPHAQWGKQGNRIYFNGVKDGVPNIGTALIKNGTATQKRAITAEFKGASLWDVTLTPNGQTKLWAQTMESHSRSMVTVYPLDFSAQSDSALTFDLPSAPLPETHGEAAIQWENEYEKIPSTPYKPLANIYLEQPLALPYYVNTDDFGIGAYINLSEPLQKHKFNFSGIISFPSLLDNSFFYTSYTNNMFKPRIKLSYSHLSASSDLLGLVGQSIEVETRDVVALSALWKLTGLSRGYNNWYAGVMVRHLAFDYFSESVTAKKYPDIIYDNTITSQTDLRLALTWRMLKPYRHTLIHPLDARGVQLSITGANDILGSKVEYMRLNLQGYVVLPAVGKQRIYLYANGVLDIGEPAGRDYLAFSDDGEYGLPDPNFMGGIDPGTEQFVRGYTHNVLGERFLFGTIEYRIPWKLDSSKELFGFIPPARTALALFMDAGVMGGARRSKTESYTEYRYSVGAEIKRVFGFGEDFKLTYELGLAQPLNKAFSPQPYFTIRSVIPF